MLDTRRNSRGPVGRIVRFAALASIAATTGGVLGSGCDSPTQFDDFCSWVRDEENCYREFFIDIGTKCGSTGLRTGSFLSRDKLDVCVLAEGGQVIFDPPISLDTPPPDNAAPVKVKIINPDATLCGTLEFRAQYDFTVSIESDPIPDGVLPEDVGEEYIEGGTFTMSGGKSTDALAVTCAPKAVSVDDGSVGTKEAYNFDRLQLADCEDVQRITPQAELEFNPGGVEINGVVRLFVTYPPIEGELENSNPLLINYYDCVIPGALPLCENGVQDGAETDIDCGGGFCSARCEDSQKCISNDDCLSDVCTLQEGLKKCAGP